MDTVIGTTFPIENYYSRNRLLTEYLHFNNSIVTSSEKIDKIKGTEEFAAMPEYPKHGCTKLIDGILVVKLNCYDN